MAKKKKVGRPRKANPLNADIKLYTPCSRGLYESVEAYRKANGYRSMAEATRKIIGDAMVDAGLAEAVCDGDDGARATKGK